MPVKPSDDTDQELLDSGDQSIKPIKMTNEQVARELHRRSASGEALLPHDHKFLSDYHMSLSRTDGPYDGLDKD